MTGGLRFTVVSRIFRPEPSAASFRLGALVDALRRDGNEVDVLTVAAPQAVPDEVPGLRVRRWPVLRDRSGYVRGYIQYLSFDVPAFFRVLLGRRPSVVVAEPPPTTGAVVRLACAVRRVPYVYYAADIWSDASAGTGSPRAVVAVLRAVERWAMQGAARVIAVNEEVAERVRELGARRVEVVRNGIDTEVFRPDGDLVEDAPSGPYAVYAGTTSEWQGAEVFVDAMAVVRPDVPDATLVFLGQGSAWESLRARAGSLPDGGACVRMVGQVPAPRAAAWLRGAVAGVVSLKPGQGYDLAFPTKIFAAVASGTPVLYAGPGRAREVVERERLGRAVEHDVAEVADALRTLFTAPAPSLDERERLHDWARANASVRRTGERAAAVVLAAAVGSRG